MVCNLIDFVPVVFKLLMFIVCEITAISKIKVFNFSSTETKLNKVKVKKLNKIKKSETIQNLQRFLSQLLFK